MREDMGSEKEGAGGWGLSTGEKVVRCCWSVRGREKFKRE